MEFWEFIEKLSKKILTYKPMSRICWYDEKTRESVAQIPKKRNRGRPKKENDNNNTMNFKTFKRAWHTRNQVGRLCGDLEMFQKHVLTKGNMNNPKVCEVCGIDRYTTCGLCKTSVNCFP